MTVVRKCETDALAIELDVTAGETLLYEVEFEGGAQPTFAIVNQHGVEILASGSEPDGDGVYRSPWPKPELQIEVPNDLTHTLGMHFVFATKYGYRIHKRDAAGTSTLVKDCTYESEPHSSTDHFFAPFRIFTS